MLYVTISFFNNSLNNLVLFNHLLSYFFYSFLKYSGSQEKVTQSKDSGNEDNWSTTFKQNRTHGRGDEMKDILQISQRSLDKPSHFGKMHCPFQFPLQISEDLHFSKTL